MVEVEGEEHLQPRLQCWERWRKHPQPETKKLVATLAYWHEASWGKARVNSVMNQNAQLPCDACVLTWVSVSLPWTKMRTSAQYMWCLCAHMGLGT